MKSNSKSHFLSLKNPSELQFEYVNCYFCGSDNFEPFLVGQDDLTGKNGNFLYVKCCKCGLVYLNPRVSIGQIKDFYDDKYIAHDRNQATGIAGYGFKRGIKKHDQMKDKIISRYLDVDSNTQILDVGCAIGTFLQHMHKKYGAQVSGVDFKDLTDYPEASMIKSYLGLFYDQDFKGKKFDCITMWHFLEHCYDPNRSLEMAKKILKDDGFLIIEIPRLDSVSYLLQGKRWPGVQAPQHTAMYDKKLFLQMVEKAGFEVFDYLPWGAFPSYFYLYFGFLFQFLGGKGINLHNHFWSYYIGYLATWPVLIWEKKLNLSMQTAILKKKNMLG